MSQTFLSKFHELTDGNWRNSFYIECVVCPYERAEGCGDFLFVPDERGQPILIPVRLVEAETGLIDWSECLGKLSNLMFRELFHRWLAAGSIGQNGCPFWGAAVRPNRTQ